MCAKVCFVETPVPVPLGRGHCVWSVARRRTLEATFMLLQVRGSVLAASWPLLEVVSRYRSMCRTTETGGVPEAAPSAIVSAILSGTCEQQCIPYHHHITSRMRSAHSQSDACASSGTYQSREALARCCWLYAAQCTAMNFSDQSVYENVGRIRMHCRRASFTFSDSRTIAIVSCVCHPELLVRRKFIEICGSGSKLADRHLL